MAVLKGNSNALSGVAIRSNENLPDSLFSLDRNLFPNEGSVPVSSVSDPTIEGNTRFKPRIPMQKRVCNGWMGDAYSDDLYHRVHFIPESVDFGVFSTDTGVHVLLWNAFLSNKDLTEIVGVDLQGIGLSGTLPVETLQSHSVYHYDVDADANDGPAQVDGRFLFTIGGIVYTLAVTGDRSIFFPYLPNWAGSNAVSEKLAWNNSVFRSESGKVQVSRYTENPAQTFGWNILLEGKQYQVFENMMWKAQWRDFLIPVPTDVGWAMLSADANADDTTLYITNDEYLSFFDDGLMVLYASDSLFEVVNIESYSTGVVELVRPLKLNWQAGVDVFPVTSAHVGNSQTVSAHTDSIVVAALNWSCDPVVNTPFLPEEEAPLTYNGHELYLQPPNRVKVGSIGFQADYDSFSQANYIYRDQNQDHSTITRTFEWLLEGREAIYHFRAFLARRDGFRVPCYMPIWQSAFALVDPVFAAGDQIIVEDNQFSKFVGVHPARAHILMDLTNGDMLPLEVTGVTDNLDGTIQLDLSGPVGRDVTPDQVIRIYNLPLWRMNDMVSLSWASNGVLVPTVSFSTDNP